jgi:hypothetical protein
MAAKPLNNSGNPSMCVHTLWVYWAGIDIDDWFILQIFGRPLYKQDPLLP